MLQVLTVVSHTATQQAETQRALRVLRLPEGAPMELVEHAHRTWSAVYEGEGRGCFPLCALVIGYPSLHPQK